MTTDELPRPNIAINETLRVNACGAWDGIVGQTDSIGIARVKLAPPIVARLDLAGPSGPSRALSPDEMRILFSEKQLTLHW